MTTEEYEETLDGKKKYELVEECLRLHAALAEIAALPFGTLTEMARDIAREATEVEA